MPGSKRISEGKCACYGGQQHSDYSDMLIWRNRLHNERSGMSNHDNTGVNTVSSLMWNPGLGRGHCALASFKRQSELKRIQDFGVGAGNTPRPPAVTFARPATTAAVRTLPAAKAAEPAAGTGDAAGGGYLDTETGRLQASAHARQLGQTFLLAGNLPQAKYYLAKAEQFLQVDAKYLPK